MNLDDKDELAQQLRKLARELYPDENEFSSAAGQQEKCFGFSAEQRAHVTGAAIIPPSKSYSIKRGVESKEELEETERGIIQDVQGHLPDFVVACNKVCGSVTNLVTPQDMFPFPATNSRDVLLGLYEIIGMAVKYAGLLGARILFTLPCERRLPKKEKDRLEKQVERMAKIKSLCREAKKSKIDLLVFHQDAFAGEYQNEEIALLGMCVKYIGLSGMEVVFHGKNGETIDYIKRLRGVPNP